MLFIMAVVYLQATIVPCCINFTASLSSTMQGLSAGSTIVFDDVNINLGNGYSNSNGVFTCPNNGHYFFMTSLMSGPTDKISAEIVVDGVAKASVLSKSGNINCSIFLLVDLYPGVSNLTTVGRTSKQFAQHN